MIGVVCLMLLAVVVSGCDTRRHIYQDAWVTVHYSIDWADLSRVTKGDSAQPNGATLAFYPTSGYLEEPLFKQTNYTEGDIKLPIGRYNVIVFNETLKGHDYIYFAGSDSYDTFTAYWSTTKVDAEYSRSSSDQMILNTDDFLLVDRKESFEIDYTMSEGGESVDITFNPVVVNKKMSVLAHIEGLVNVSSSRSSLLYIEGMASGYKMWSGGCTEDSLTHLMSLGDLSYNSGSDRDGTMSASFYTFGDKASATRVDDSNTARLSFALRDGTTHPDIEIDITDEVSMFGELSEIDVELGMNGEISLPDVDNTEAGGGIDTDVGGWGDEIIVDLY